MNDSFQLNKVQEKTRRDYYRTENQHWWTGRIDLGDWDNYAEGTRQNNPVTSG